MILRRTFFLWSFAGLLALGSAALFLCPTPPEPVWKGHRLSEWLDMYDSSLRFEAGDGRHPRFTDEEIQQALDGIGTNALPFLRRWLAPAPNRVKPWLNAQFARLRWVRFRFAVDAPDRATIAETGFMYYGTTAQPLLPWLTKMSRSTDANTRLLAYEAAFFTRPEREVFLPLADRALQDTAAGCDDMAAQWMVTRFPEEAAKRNLRSRFPQFYE